MKMKVTQVILARHGETEWNASGIFRGQADIPLNEKGLKQADLLGEYLKEREISAVYSSPLKRALKTAGAIAARHGLKIITAPALTDIDYGKWEGSTAEKVEQQYPEEYHNWLKEPELAVIPGGEQLSKVKDRAFSFLKYAVERHEGESIVMVSHRVVHKVLICGLLGTGPGGFNRIKLDNAAITCLDFNGSEAVLFCHNDTSFLKSLNTPALADF